MKFTESMTLHLNGGSKFSELHSRVSGDGRELPIMHRRRTDGSPKYLITDDVFHCTACDAEFDRLAAEGAGLVDWLTEHAGHAADAPPAPTNEPEGLT